MRFFSAIISNFLGTENEVCFKTAFVKRLLIIIMIIIMIIIIIVTIVTSIVNVSCFEIIQSTTRLEKQDFSFLLGFKIIQLFRIETESFVFLVFVCCCF